jgi:hypothetical protein
MPKTRDYMVVDHSDGLHEGITDRRTDEAKAFLFQIAAHGIGLLRRGWNLSEILPVIDDRLMIDELPEVCIKASMSLLNSEKGPGVLYGGFNLQTIANYARICQQLLLSSCGKSRDFLGIEILKGFAIILAPLQNSQPTESCLRALQQQNFKQPLVFVNRNAPLAVVILHVEIISQTPGTSLEI